MAPEATLYLDGTGKTLKVEYGTVYDTVNELFDPNKFRKKKTTQVWDMILVNLIQK